MQNFELSVEKSRVTEKRVFKNGNVKYHKILYVFYSKPSFSAPLKFKLFARGDMYTTRDIPAE